MCYEAIVDLEHHSEEIFKTFCDAWETYLRNPDIYEEHLTEPVNPRDIPPSDVQPHHTTRMLETGIIEEVDAKNVRAWLRAFNVLELAKGRFRNIQWTRTINELLPDSLQVVFNPMEFRRQLVNKASCAAERDFKSYYHQFLLSVLIRNFFALRLPVPEGGTKLFRLCVGATGQKHMVHVACATTNALLNFPREDVICDTQIDNVLFAGSPIQVAEALATLCQRCEKVDVTINDPTDDFASIIKTKLTWCGIVLDFENKRVSVGEKSLKKLELSWSQKSTWTWQGFAAHMGLLWWSFQIHRYPIARFFNLLRFVSTTSQAMQAADDKHWHHTAIIHPHVWLDLDAWTKLALDNAPTFVPVPPAPESVVKVLVDASSHGWGFVAYDPVAERTHQLGQPWTPAFAEKHATRLGKSTFTEPWAILLTKAYLVKSIGRPNIAFHFGSDNAPTVYIFKRRFSARSYDMNNAAFYDDKHFLEHPCTYVHVPGKRNVLADAKSRGLSINDSAVFGDTDIISSLQRLLGDSPAECDDQNITTGAGKNEADVFPNSFSLIDTMILDNITTYE